MECPEQRHKRGLASSRRPRPSPRPRTPSRGPAAPRAAGPRARSRDGCSVRGSVGRRAERLTAARTTPTTASTAKTARQLSPSSKAAPVAAAPRTAPPLKSVWKRTSRPGLADNAAAETTFITTSRKPPAAVTRVKATAKIPSAGAAATPRSSAPQIVRACAECAVGAPTVGERAPDRVEARRRGGSRSRAARRARVGEPEGALDVEHGDRPRPRERRRTRGRSRRPAPA